MKNTFLSVLLLLLLLSLTSCLNEHNLSDNYAVLCKIKTDSTILNTKKMKDVSIVLNMRRVINKLKSNKKLSDKEFNIICEYLVINMPKDESMSEEFGYCFYTYMVNNIAHNNDFSEYLIKTRQAYQDSVLSSLVQSMCIDLGEENYNYNQLINDFPIFLDNNVAETAFIECMDYQVE